jgi:hypothetical protein
MGDSSEKFFDDMIKECLSGSSYCENSSDCGLRVAESMILDPAILHNSVSDSLLAMEYIQSLLLPINFNAQSRESGELLLASSATTVQNSTPYSITKSTEQPKPNLVKINPIVTNNRLMNPSKSRNPSNLSNSASEFWPLPNSHCDFNFNYEDISHDMNIGTDIKYFNYSSIPTPPSTHGHCTSQSQSVSPILVTDEVCKQTFTYFFILL